MDAAALQRFALPIGRNRDLLLVFSIIGILMAILLPIPPLAIDGLLALNVTISLLILMTSVYMRSPLDFSVFPSLLLVMTLFRLALNIGTTRLILSRGATSGGDDAAAGRVIEVFGNVVTAGNAVVGVIIFTVIVIIQFVVITKGATRVAEVAARFTLDKMPGQQLSIDADLAAGLIDDNEARERRETIRQEADFYGAMDGASKFVRGDAIAGILITLINIVGGLAIGMMNDLPFERAVEVYTKLTIGDGLVSQVPALLVSVAAALIVTRQSSDSNLGLDLMAQVFSSPRAITVTAVFVLLLIGIGLPPLFMIPAALALGVISWGLTDREKSRVATEEEEEQRVEVENSKAPPEVKVGLVDPVELEVGYGLVNLVDPGDGAGLVGRIAMIRQQIATELGLVVPPIRIRDNMQLKPEEYTIKLRGEPIATHTVHIDQYLAMDPGLGLDPVEGLPTKEPSFGIDALWIDEATKPRAEAIGYTVVDIESVLATHLTEVLREHADELLTRDETNRLIDRLKSERPAVVDDLVPDLMKVGEVQRVLQNLLAEKVSIRDLEAILEALGDWAPRTKDLEVLTEYARNAIRRSICRQYLAGDSKLHVVTLDPRLEEYFSGAIEHNDRGSVLKLSPDQIGPIVRSISVALERLVGQGYSPVILTAPQSRSHLRRVISNQVAGVACLSYNEVSDCSVEAHAVAKVE